MKPFHALSLLIIVASGCGPGVTDGAYPISKGYLFYDTGSNGKTIRYEERRDWSTTIVSERVDAYVLDGHRIIIARRPAEAMMRDGIADWKLSSMCEYWIIDVETHAVEQIADASKWPSVRCDMGNAYGATVEHGN
ncbi:MAG: hypothetical protein LC114_16340 [Bryobacterales bacterium]|jgi:hypothetical protein|nr:hypothetical protein [Bryobacterales bacterium]